jgi:hypothetical protein
VKAGDPEHAKADTGPSRSSTPSRCRDRSKKLNAHGAGKHDRREPIAEFCSTWNAINTGFLFLRIANTFRNRTDLDAEGVLYA